MAKQLEVFYDFISPYTYLASTRLEALAKATQADISWHPMNLRELMPMVGNRPTTLESANKGQYAFKDIGRWAARYQVPFNINPHWGKFDHRPMLSGALVALDLNNIQIYNSAMFKAMWVDRIDLGNEKAFVTVLDQAGLQGEKISERARTEETLAKLSSNTKLAADKGAFGSPTFWVGEDMFFGNDRLDWVEQSLRR
jgi:2-hydroxychromene-2-carboxylate isomerase